MISILLTTIVGALCFFIIIINFVEKKNNTLFNNYLISILTIAGLVRLVPLLGFILSELDYESIMNILTVSVIFLTPLFFLNLNAVVRSSKTKGYVHFIIPTLLLIYFMIFQSISKLKFGVFIIAYSSLYITMTIVLVVKFLRKIPENIIVLLYKKKVKNWLIVLTSFSIYCYLITLYNVSNFIFSVNLFEVIYAYILTSIGYLITLTYIILNRNLILGSNTLNNYKEVSLLFWSFSPLKKIDQKDSPHYKKLIPEELINGIIDWQRDFQQVLDDKFNYGFISDSLKIPLYKVKLLFKYHTLLSLTEFINVLKIFNALILIDKGYLNSFTIESLGKKVGFNSRITFHNNFIKFMGLSVRKYVNQKE